MKLTRQTVFMLSTALLLGACAQTPPRTTPNDNIGKALQQAAQPPQSGPGQVPAAVSNALLPQSGGLSGNGLAPHEERFDVSVKDMDASAFFMSLVKGTPYNVVVQPGVSGRISLTLKNVTVPQVMDMVRDAYGFDYRRTGDNYLVLPATQQTRVFHVNYLDFVRKSETRTRIASGETTNSNYNPLQQGGTSNPGTAQAGANSNQQEVGTNIETKTESDFWKDLDATLNTLIGNKDGDKVIVDADTGIIIVRAMPGELRNVQSYLKSVQATTDREVVIEAKFIEVTLNHNFQAGIDWAALGKPGSGKTILAGQIGGQKLFDNGVSDLAGTAYTLGGGAPLASLPSSAFGGTFAAALNLNDFTGMLELLDAQGNVQVLSSPRVATVNNQPAIIKVGNDEFFVTGLNSNTVGNAAGNTSNQNIILTPFFSGIALDVTPQINGDGYVTLHIHPAISEVKDQIKNITFAGQNTSVPLAYSTIRESDSVVRAKSGQIVVIGGLMKTQTQDQVDKTPLLSDIPLVGSLFTQTRKVSVKTELVILLKPIVIGNDSDWSKLAKDHLDNYHALSGDSGSQP
ncbi:MAG TPA: pilus (MSHA type) biogenesis protein MshL [Gammaproteobacteria bacterium]|nr:pilus (MSHA type) biogenesis protein MshL [Gammaproteobacteria bacterium]